MEQARARRQDGTAAYETRRAAAAVTGLLLGAFLIFGVGFAAPAAIHNAAHDSRHAFTFPCH